MFLKDLILEQFSWNRKNLETQYIEVGAVKKE